MQLDLRDEDVVDPVDLAFIEIGIICTGAALVVNDAQALAQVVKEIGAGADQAVHLSLPQKVGDELAQARRHHGAGQAEEDGNILIQHALPDAQRCAELASLKAHLAHIRYQIGYTPLLHGYCSPYLLAVADKIMTVTVIHFIPQDFFSTVSVWIRLKIVDPFDDYPSLQAVECLLPTSGMKLYIPKSSLKQSSMRLA